ncbi:MAG: UDP-N-acetylmuramoyl-L-alanyl-D-glutamate--2,6-diaminopimelate ligase [Planctomycetes bacterium]|nr:UDP-N-acetylmuramoyl-L-alanyl-D-glutamate--2,6-diaminopimelate ligase [Planctomycetota bacterium]
MKLSDLCPRVSAGRARVLGSGDPEIQGIQTHSKRVRTGDLFVAIAGSRDDGSRHVEEARTRGAVAVIVEREIPGLSLPSLIVPSARTAAAQIAALLLRDPQRSMTMLGVTGTNGKTTSASLMRWILERDGRSCGLLSTISYSLGARELPSSHTTPDPVALFGYLRELLNAGVAYCAMEVSSHALDQDRVHGIPFAVAAFTNLTGDHLDYHKDFDSYLRAKKRLFDGLSPSATAVANAQDPSTPRMLADTKARRVLYGIDGERHPAGAPEVMAKVLRTDLDGAEWLLRAPGVEALVRSPLLGAHNIQNALAAAASALAIGVAPESIVAGIETIGMVPGRLERVDGGKPFRVFVDYAHTDDGLDRVLSTLRPLTRGRVIVVFGCGGDRDRTKRPRMGSVAHRLADLVIVTSDNPRSERPEAIAEEIVAGIPAAARGNIVVELDRRRAIRHAVSKARAGDVVLIAGKGHEDYQILGADRISFDDRQVAREALRGAH